jgi:hypothetical protein
MPEKSDGNAFSAVRQFDQRIIPSNRSLGHAVMFGDYRNRDNRAIGFVGELLELVADGFG